MEIYLIQHGEAKSKEEDPERPLSDLGSANIKKTAAFFKKLDKKIDAIWHSGLKRAEQTAEILADSLGLDSPLKKYKGLTPNDDISIIKKDIESANLQAIALVGHLPHLSRLASDLLTDDEDQPIIQFKNAGIVSLSQENEDWIIRWIITPDIIPAG